MLSQLAYSWSFPELYSTGDITNHVAISSAAVESFLKTLANKIFGENELNGQKTADATITPKLVSSLFLCRY
jgi:hypothetical protein